MKPFRLIFALVVFLCLTMAGTALAAQKGGGFTGPGTPNATAGGFTGPGTPVATVEQAKTMPDDSYVTLRGNIESSLGDKHYMFRDSSGSIRVEISSRRWNGQTVSPADLVEIQGEVDKDWNSVEIDVKRLTKLPKTQ